MDWRQCRPWVIRTTYACAVSWPFPAQPACTGSMTCSHCIPSLNFLAEQWGEKQLAVVHAVATPYRERSHFDAQDVLESGYARPHAAQSGWLNRALSGLPAASAAGRNAGVALGANVPLVMRGPTEVASWSPGRLPDLEGDTLQRIAQMYGDDPSAVAAPVRSTGCRRNGRDGNHGWARAVVSGGAGGSRRRVRQPAFSRDADGPRVAVFETTGWDTHANQGSDKGALALRLAALDAGLKALHDALGESWNRTVVLVATEFGRTAAINGTRGTDHGTAAAAFLLGGAVRGGKVFGQWPGLKAAICTREGI